MARFHRLWYQSVGLIKLSVYKTLTKTVPNSLTNSFTKEKIDALVWAAEEIVLGKHFDHFIVPPLSGGAGTSINMNINEILTNLALQKVKRNPGDYAFISPLDHANIFQSTNDVIPSALKIALLKRFKPIEIQLNRLRVCIEQLEQRSRGVMRPNYTQMQEAIPSSFGHFWSGYSEAFSRDWWRLCRMHERLKTLSLGGNSQGSGFGVPTEFIFEVYTQLREESGLTLCRADNLTDATCHWDNLVEVHSFIKCLAVNLERFVTDLRLLSADLFRFRQIQLKPAQVGSSAMPGKVNPVNAEYVVQICQQIYSSDSLITQLASMGCLELNAYVPLMGHHALQSCDFIELALQKLTDTLEGVKFVSSEWSPHRAPTITTCLIPRLGYSEAEKIVYHMKNYGCDIFEAMAKLHSEIPLEQIQSWLNPSTFLKMGYETESNISSDSQSLEKK